MNSDKGGRNHGGRERSDSAGEKSPISAPLMLGLVAAVLFGSATPASKALLGSLSTFQLAGLLYLGAAVGVVPLLVKERTLSLPWRLPGKTGIQLLGAVIFGGLLGPVLLLFGLRLASSASVALWLNLELVATVVLGQIFFRDRLNAFSAIAALGVLAGAALLSISEGQTGIWAGGLVFLACICWGMDNHLTALIDGISPAATTFWKGLAAGSVNFLIGVYAVEFHAPPSIVGLAILVGVFAYGISIVLYIASAQQLGATRSQIVFSSSPFFGVLLSALFLGESISSLQVIAMLLIAGSLGFLIFERHAHEHLHTEIEHGHAHGLDDEHHNHDHPKGLPVGRHSHWHVHEPTVHSHQHLPDLHHRHDHDKKKG